MSLGLKSKPQFQSITNLITAAQYVADSPDFTLYNRSTAKEFHCFLTAIILGFAKSLHSITAYIDKVCVFVNIGDGHTDL